MPTKTSILREKEWRTCKGRSPQDVDALIFFLETHCKIQHPERGSILFALRPAQRAILETWMIERYSIVLKARQIGWSTLVACYALWLAYFWPDNSVMMLSKGEREAEKLLQKATYAYERLPAWMRDRGPARLTKNLKKLAFANASVIESLPSKEDPGRSATASLVIVDEWAFLENAEEAWASIEPISDIGGRVIGLSTANGSGDFFQRFYNMAVAKVTDFKAMFYPWWANDERDDEWYATKQRTMLEWQLHQEYPNTPEEAFIKSGNPVFDVDALEQMGVSTPERGFLVTHANGVRQPDFEPAHNGQVRVWEHPQYGDKYVVGADVAEGLEHGDFSCGYVLSIKHHRVVACWHGHAPADVFGEQLAILGYYYRTAFVGVEANNHGLSTLHQLQRMQYPRLFFRRQLDQRTHLATSRIGWFTNATSKPVLIDELGRALRTTLVVEDDAAIGELRTYTRDDRGRTSGSPFDDRVMALAIANQMIAESSVPQARDDKAPPKFSPEWWKRQFASEGARRMEDPIGVYNRRRDELTNR